MNNDNRSETGQWHVHYGGCAGRALLVLSALFAAPLAAQDRHTVVTPVTGMDATS